METDRSAALDTVHQDGRQNINKVARRLVGNPSFHRIFVIADMRRVHFRDI